MELEARYEAAQYASDATVANIRRACAAFMRQHPEFVPSARNEQILFAAMSAPENDHLSPTSVASWEDVYAQNRELIDRFDKPRPVARRRPSVAPVSTLTYEEIDGWDAVRLRKELERSPARAAEIEEVLSRKR
jgi:hypothetical protein